MEINKGDTVRHTSGDTGRVRNPTRGDKGFWVWTGQQVKAWRTEELVVTAKAEE